MNLTQTAVINGHDIKNMLLEDYKAIADRNHQIDKINVITVQD